MGNQKEKQENNVVQLPSRCKAEGCSKKSERAEFCNEHFTWFKEGLVTKEGKKPLDFERKLYYFNRRKSAA
ncbi:MAG: hypothetical protein IPM57_06220 [Oligoflexia bacterium]|nr:hypothetical protein [Oligoflexia bacterium]